MLNDKVFGTQAQKQASAVVWKEIIMNLQKANNMKWLQVQNGSLKINRESNTVIFMYVTIKWYKNLMMMDIRIVYRAVLPANKVFCNVLTLFKYQTGIYKKYN
jgi:hypothetical protein